MWWFTLKCGFASTHSFMRIRPYNKIAIKRIIVLFIIKTFADLNALEFIKTQILQLRKGQPKFTQKPNVLH